MFLSSRRVSVRLGQERMDLPQWVQAVFRVGSLLALTSGMIGCGTPISQRECEDLLLHYTDKQIEQARPSISSRQRVELEQAAQSKAQLDPEFSRCSSAVSRTQFQCAMSAQSADQIERCLM